jgi:hypothetical protein
MKKFGSYSMQMLKALLIACLLTACSTTQYATKANKAPDFAGRLTRVTIWSGIATVPLLSGRKALGMDDTFSNFFSETLKSDLANQNVISEIHPYATETDKLDDLARFEQSFAPEYRMVIAIPHYGTITSQGHTNVLDITLDVSLYRIKDNSRIWRGEMVVDGGLVPGLTWRETGAKTLAHKLLEMLKNDHII